MMEEYGSPLSFVSYSSGGLQMLLRYAFTELVELPSSDGYLFTLVLLDLHASPFDRFL